MKKSIIILALLLTGCSSTYYAKIGAGYKFSESNIEWDDKSTNHPISARMEIGAKKGPIIYGVSHRSQYFTGPPFNDKMEYEATEVFIDYEFEF